MDKILKDMPLGLVVGRPVLEMTKMAIFKLSGGKLDVTGNLAAEYSDTNYRYTLFLYRRDGRKLTKAQLAWASAVIEGIRYVMR